jgi:L-fuconolactonase
MPDESAIDPKQLIIDAHHHLYERPGLRYLADSYCADIADCPGFRASVYVQAHSAYRVEGPEELRPVGETEFARGVESNGRLCAGIVGFADLTLGDRLRPVLEAHIEAGAGRFRGIRHILCWDQDDALLNKAYPTTEDMIDRPEFKAGYAHLSRFDLTFDSWALFPQLSRVASLAKAFPNTPLIVNHCGGVVRINDYAKRGDVFEVWRDGITALSQLPNVSIKLSGLGMALSGFDFEASPTSAVLARAWQPWVMHCLESFGSNRCMWGSNFPVDRRNYTFNAGLNAFKRLLATASPDEKDDVFWRTAARTYRLDQPDL